MKDKELYALLIATIITIGIGVLSYFNFEPQEANYIKIIPTARAFIVDEPLIIPVLESGLVPLPNSIENGNSSYLGDFKATFYCNCRKCCGKWAGGNTASGTKPQAGRTIAVDTRKIKLGTKVYIEFESPKMSEYNGYYIAEDTGSAIKQNRIDIYVDSHDEALACGIRNVRVII